METGDTVYVWFSHRSFVNTLRLEEIGITHAIVRDIRKGVQGYPEEFYIVHRDNVFATKQAAMKMLTAHEPAVGDYVAVKNGCQILKGLVVKTSAKMVEILPNDEDHIPRSKGKMTRKHHKANCVVLVKANQNTP